MPPTIIYLHGFASSPNGTKARFLQEQCQKQGILFHAPDLNVPNFEQLTITAMIEQVAQTVAGCEHEPIYMIGSSLGGFVLLHFMNQHSTTIAQRVRKVIFLAPAFRKVWQEDDAFEFWRETGWTTVFHHGYGEHRKLHFHFTQDLQCYDSYQTQVNIPMTIIHGLNDAIVLPQISRDFLAQNPNAVVQWVNSGHELHDQLGFIWQTLLEFFEL